MTRDYTSPMGIDERLEALVMSIELLVRESHQHPKQSEVDGEHIISLTRNAEISLEKIVRPEKPLESE